MVRSSGLIAVITAIYDETDRVERFLTIMQDSTAQHAMEKALVQAVAHLEAVNRRLKDLDDGRSFSIAAASHELQSPLTSLKGYIENLLEGVAGSLPDKVMHYLRRMERNADRVLRLATMLLDQACLEAGHIPLDIRAVSLAEVLDDLLPEFQRVAAKKAIALQVGPLTDARVKADRQKLEQILQNLIHNAIKFTPEEGGVFVRSHVSDETQMIISVEDTGCGIPDNDQAKVFFAVLSRAFAGAGRGGPWSRHYQTSCRTTGWDYSS